MSGQVRQIPVAKVTATGTIDYADLTRTVDGVRLTVTAAPGNEARVSGEVSQFGVDVPATALCSVAAKGNRITVTVRSVEIAGIPLNTNLTSTITDTFGFSRAVTLPFGLELTGAQTTPNGLVVSAKGSGLILSR